MVPRIGQVRRIAPRSMAASTLAALAPWVRSPSAHSDWAYSWDWTAPSHRVTSTGSALRGAASN